MKRNFAIVFIFILLTACSSGASPAAQTVENYLKALADKNETILLSYTCPDYEADALLEYDAFALVDTMLNNVSCQESGKDGDTVLVICQGSVEASYGGEIRDFELAERRYRVVNLENRWLVCGYTK